MKFCPRCQSDKVFSIFIKAGRSLGSYKKDMSNSFIKTELNGVANTKSGEQLYRGIAKISHLLFHCDNCFYEWRENCRDYTES